LDVTECGGSRELSAYATSNSCFIRFCGRLKVILDILHPLCYTEIEIGETPITKNGNSQKQINTKGATPIEKNVIVVDEQGNEYEATYPKRAKGLVKNGRARFIDENTICLACPPDNLEEKMDNQNIENATYSIEYALGQLEKLRIEFRTFDEKICEMIEKNKSAGPGDVGAQGNGQTLEALVREHGATTQKLVDFYQNMVKELKPISDNKRETLEKFLDFVVDSSGASGTAPNYNEIWEMMTK